MKHDTVLMSVCPCSFFGRKLLNCLQISVVLYSSVLLLQPADVCIVVIIVHSNHSVVYVSVRMKR